MQGRPQDALPEIDLVRYDPVRAFLYAIAYHALGREKESDAALSEVITKYNGSRPYETAEVYAFRNQSNEAFEWLERAHAQRDTDSCPNEDGSPAEELARRSAIRRVLEKAQSADLSSARTWLNQAAEVAEVVESADINRTN